MTEESFAVEDSDVVIDGQNKFSINPAEDKKRLRLLGDDITLKNLSESDVHVIVNGTNVEVLNNDIKVSDFGGVYFNLGASGKVSGNKINSGGQGIGAKTAGDLIISNNDIKYTSKAIELFDVNGAVEEINNTDQETSFDSFDQYTIFGNTFNKID